MNHRRSRAFTLLETVVSMGSVSVLLLAMGSVMVVAGQALPSPDDRAARAVAASRALDIIADDLAVATGVTIHAGVGVEFTVPDRSGDAAEETVQCRLSGAELVRAWIDTASAKVVLLDGVSAFAPVAIQSDGVTTGVELVITLADMPGEPFRRTVALLNEQEAP